MLLGALPFCWAFVGVFDCYILCNNDFSSMFWSLLILRVYCVRFLGFLGVVFLLWLWVVWLKFCVCFEL